jgi:hypothetical protein
MNVRYAPWSLRSWLLLQWTRFRIKCRMSSSKPGGPLLILGSDMGNSFAGFTIAWRELRPFGEWRMFRHCIRVNVRMPITFSYRKHRGR